MIFRAVGPTEDSAAWNAPVLPSSDFYATLALVYLGEPLSLEKTFSVQSG